MVSSTTSRETAESLRLGVLVVDDDDHLLRTLADILRHQGYDPTTAATGYDGLAAARGRPEPAIALVDLALPDMDGLELVRQLRDLSAFTEVVILTGNATLDSAVGALREQSYDYLIKPVPPDRLVETMNRAGERWRRRRAEDALRSSEARLRLVVENIPELVLLVGHEGEITYANPALRGTLGLDPDEVLGRRVTELVQADDRERALRLLTAPSSDSVEIRLRRHDGRAGLFSCRACNLFPRSPSTGRMFIAADVTEKRRLEAQAHQAQKLDSIGRLAGGMAHDFNNLLSVVLGYSDLALRALPADSEVEHLLTVIREAGQRGAALTSQLLAFARKQPAATRLLDLAELVGGLQGLLRRTLGEDVELAFDLAPGAGRIRADPAQVEQVLMNLVINAREAMPDGGRMWVSARRVEAATTTPSGSPGAEPHVALSVRDSGCGMSEEVQERLFEPFFTTKDTGTGLGLATTYGIVRQAGGGIEVESRPGEGTCFTVWFPIVGEVPAALPAAADAPAGTAEMPAGSETVLVVEDEPMVRNLVCRVLESQGYRVLVTESGREALERVRRSGARPELLLTDLVMPGLGGEEVARLLQAELPGLKVLLMSGYSDRAPATGPGAPRLLPKPFTPASLTRAVRATLDARPGPLAS